VRQHSGFKSGTRNSFEGLGDAKKGLDRPGDLGLRRASRDGRVLEHVGQELAGAEFEEDSGDVPKARRTLTLS
jgi:hypothetical protein